MLEKAKSVWMNGKLIDWDNANVHILTHSLHYGLAAFEGIRCYNDIKEQLNAFRLKAHIRRLFDSCKIVNLKVPYSFDQIFEACKETVAANNIGECYIRPLVYIGYGSMGVYPGDEPKVDIAIAVWKWGKYLGEGALEKGVKVKVSTFCRYSPNSVMTRGKITGSYATGVLAKMEALKHGYHEAILLDQQGFVSEGTGENIFITRDGKIKTTAMTVILPGITRDSVIKIAKGLGYEVSETRFTKDEIYIADEVFFTGTASEITPVVNVDDRIIGNGKPGPITKQLQEAFFSIVMGKNNKYKEWLDSINTTPAKKKKKATALKV